MIDRLVNGYGVGYIKMDYNIQPGPGTELNADSAGDGLLSHTRAYLAWLDGVFGRYPDLTIENCGSGGMRMEYSLLSRLSIQSVTDQTDYPKMAAIACNCMTAVTPEQAAIWSYPLRDGDREETAFNMVSAMLLRVHQSGHLAELTPERLQLVKEASPATFPSWSGSRMACPSGRLASHPSPMASWRPESTAAIASTSASGA